LRQDNSDILLTRFGYDQGLISKKRLRLCDDKMKKINEFIEFLKVETIIPVKVNEYLLRKKSAKILQKTKILELLLRPEIDIFALISDSNELSNFLIKRNISEKEILEEAEILIKYKSYIEKEKEIADKIIKLEEVHIRSNLDYNSISSISFESREKLTKIRPNTIAQASRISGVSPADIAVLLVQIGR